MANEQPVHGRAPSYMRNVINWSETVSQMKTVVNKNLKMKSCNALPTTLRRMVTPQALLYGTDELQRTNSR